MVNEEIRSLTAQGLDSCGIRLQAQQLELLFAYIAEIELWNPTYKLVSADRRDLIFRHIIDSLAPLHILTEVIDSFPDRGLSVLQMSDRATACRGYPLLSHWKILRSL